MSNGRVVDQQPDDLAVGHVDDGLPRLRVAVAGLGVGQRARLPEGVQVGAGERSWARPRRGSRGCRCGRWRGRRPTPTGPGCRGSGGFRGAPRVRPCRRGLRSRALRPVPSPRISSPRSSTTTSAPCSRSAVGVVDPVDADDVAEVTGAAGLDPGDGVLEDRRRRRARPRAPRRRPGRCPAPACPSGASRRRRSPSIRSSKRSSIPAARSTVLAVGAGGDDGAAQAGLARRFDEGDRARVGLDPVALDQLRGPVRSCGCRGRRRFPPRAGRRARPPAARSRASRGRSGRRRSAACRRRIRCSRRRRRTGRTLLRSLRARFSRKASNICFHALSWTRAVFVSTPSRSKRSAFTPAGRPRSAEARYAMRAEARANSRS